MTVTTWKKPLIILFFMAVISLLFLNFGAASAANVSVGSALFSENDNITILGTKDGLKLTSEVKANSRAKYANKLYLNKNFLVMFQVTEDYFESITFTISCDHYDKTVMGTVSDRDRQYSINIVKGTNGFSANLDGEGSVDIDKNIKSTIELRYNDANKFYLKVGGTDYVINKALDLGPYMNEGYLSVGFNGKRIDKKAGMIIKNINGQNFTGGEGTVNDNISPILRLNKSKFIEDGDNLIDNAPMNKFYKLPFYGLDVLSTNLKYTVKVTYSPNAWDSSEYDEEDEEELSFTSLDIELNKQGYYKVKEVKVNDNNGNETAVCQDFDLNQNDIIIRAWPIWNGDAATELLTWKEGTFYRPQITQFTDPVKLAAYEDLLADSLENGFVAKGGSANRFRFAVPETELPCLPQEIIDNNQVNFETMVSYKLKYRKENSQTWSTQDGLIFTASSIGKYCFKIVAIDKMGNQSDEGPEFEIFFDDMTAPKITVTGFSAERYLDQSITLPSASVLDDMGGSTSSEIKVYYVLNDKGEQVFEEDEQGNPVYEEDGVTRKKILVSEEATFTPDKLGWYEVVYTADDGRGNKTVPVDATFHFSVVEYKEPETPPPSFIDFSNVWNIVFLTIAGLSAIGLIVIMFIKPKEE